MSVPGKEAWFCVRHPEEVVAYVPIGSREGGVAFMCKFPLMEVCPACQSL